MKSILKVRAGEMVGIAGLVGGAVLSFYAHLWC